MTDNQNGDRRPAGSRDEDGFSYREFELNTRVPEEPELREPPRRRPAQERESGRTRAREPGAESREARDTDRDGDRRDFLLPMAAAAVTLMLLVIAVAPDLPDPAWSVLVIAGVSVGMLPMLVSAFRLVSDRNASAAPLMMLLALTVCICSTELLQAGIATVAFNASAAIFEGFSRRELLYAQRRLRSIGRSGDRVLEPRLESCAGEIAAGRVKPAVELRRLDRLIILLAAAVAVTVSVVPALLQEMSFAKWMFRGAAVLAVCLYSGDTGALMATANALDAAFSENIWLSGTGALAAAADVTSVLFNKTGALTDGAYRVTNLDPIRVSDEQLAYLAAYAGAYSDHPLDRAIRDYAGFTPDRSVIQRYRVQAGYGSLIQMQNQIVAVGNIDFMEKLGVQGNMYVPGETCVFVCVGRTCIGRIDFADAIRPDAVTVVHDLRRAGVANVALMTGDNALSATNIGRRVSIAEVYSDCRPQDKAARLQYIQDTQDPGDRTAFVSEAGHDRELLEMANISVSLGAGEDTTAAFPDVIIADSRLSRLPRLIRLAHEARRDMAVSFLVSSIVRLVTLILAITGVLKLWAAVLVMFVLQIFGFLNSRVSVE